MDLDLWSYLLTPPQPYLTPLPPPTLVPRSSALHHHTLSWPFPTPNAFLCPGHATSLSRKNQATKNTSSDFNSILFPNHMSSLQRGLCWMPHQKPYSISFLCLFFVALTTTWYYLIYCLLPPANHHPLPPYCDIGPLTAGTSSRFIPLLALEKFPTVLDNRL